MSQGQNVFWQSLFDLFGIGNGAGLMLRSAACQKSLAEFGGVSRQIKSNHFLSGRVPDRKYISGCKSSAAALCRAQPPQAALSASQCELFAIGEQGVRAADCKNLSEKPVRGFSTV